MVKLWIIVLFDLGHLFKNSKDSFVCQTCVHESMQFFQNCIVINCISFKMYHGIQSLPLHFKDGENSNQINRSIGCSVLFLPIYSYYGWNEFWPVYDQAGQELVLLKVNGLF